MDIENLIAQQSSQSQLNIAIPAKILVQIDGVEGYIKTLLVGMVPDHYLIMLSPKGNPNIKQKFFEGNSLLVRYFKDGTIFAFQSSIMGTTHDPYSLVFLSYPKIVSHHELRREKRASCQIPSQVLAGGKQYTSVLLDISKGGCRFAIMDRSMTSDPFKTETELDIKFRLFEDKGDFNCHGVLRNSTLEKGLFIGGVEFVDVPTEVMIAIDHFVDNTEMWSRIKSNLSHMKD